MPNRGPSILIDEPLGAVSFTGSDIIQLQVWGEDLEAIDKNYWANSVDQY